MSSRDTCRCIKGCMPNSMEMATFQAQTLHHPRRFEDLFNHEVRAKFTTANTPAIISAQIPISIRIMFNFWWGFLVTEA